MLESSGDLPGIRRMIQSHIPDAQQNRLFGRELSFVLPRSDVEKYVTFFIFTLMQQSTRFAGGNLIALVQGA